jgi:hypothetical protein
MLFQYSSTVLCGMFSATLSCPMDSGRKTQCMALMLHARFESSGYLPAGRLQGLVYAAFVDDEATLRRRIADACQVI